MNLVKPATGPASTEQISPDTIARWLIAVLWYLILGAGASASAQTFYDPYASSEASQNGVGSAGSAGASDAGGTVGNGASNLGANQTAGGALQGTGSLQNSAPGGSYSPTYLPDYGSDRSDETSGQSARDTRVTRPSGGATSGPLYVRPGTTPGQFELFQRPPPQPSEFETFVKQTIGQSLPRFGSSLVLTRARGFEAPATATVPPDYTLNPGDELLISVTGAVEAKLRLIVDNEGRIFIPRVGSVAVAGVRYGDLADALSHRFSEQFKQAKVSVVIGRLHGLTIYVTGYAVSPGAYTVSSLSTMVDAVLAAGGPSAGGSFRSIQLRRNGKPITTLDLYDLLLNGDKTHDVVLQNNDVLNIAPAGPELAVTGSVNSPAIFEAKPGESLGDVIRYAGGLNSLADDTRLVVVRLGDLDASGSQQLPFSAVKNYPAERGDIIRILSLADIARPLERQAILATVEGEVDHPGRYYLTPGSTLDDLLTRSGGLTYGAFVFGTQLQRESIRQQQQASFDKAIENLELAAVAAPISSLGGGGERSAGAAARSQAALAIIERIKERKPDGRLVLDLGPAAVTFPVHVNLENNDRIFIPPRPKTVGVFGAVYQTGSFMFTPSTRLGDYLKLAGGPQKIADRGDIFVVRANGSVISSHQGRGFASRPALPGDVIFVPVRTSPSAFDKLVEIAGVVSQFGIGALTFKALGG